MKKITIYNVSCTACGEVFCVQTRKAAMRKHKAHVNGHCKIINFWQEANKILGRELTASEIGKLLGVVQTPKAKSKGK